MLRCQFLCHVLKAIFFIKIALKLSYFCKKKQNFRALGTPPPDPRAFGDWGLCPQMPSLRQLGTLPPDPHWPPAAGGSASRPKHTQPYPIANFWLRACWSSLFSNFLNFLAPPFRKSCVRYCTESPVLCILIFSCLAVKRTLQEKTSRFSVVFYFWEPLIIFMPRRFCFNLTQ